MEKNSIKVEEPVESLIIITSNIDRSENPNNLKVKLVRFDVGLLSKPFINQEYKVCEFCSKPHRDTKDGYFGHKKICKIFVKPPKLFCDLCPYSSFKKKVIETHIKQHANKSLKQYSCKKCGQIFQTLQILDRHLSIKTTHKCFFCSIEFACRPLLIQHKKKDHQGLLKCHHCPRMLAIGLMNNHMKFHGKEFFCECCGFTTLDKQSFQRHQKSYGHGEFLGKDMRIFQCGKCPKRFVTKSILKRHGKESHIDAELLTCKICDFKCKNSRTLKLHNVSVHQGIKGTKRFHCDLCSTKSKHKSEMRLHVQIHMKERKKFTCDFCNKKMLQKTSIYQHFIHSKCPAQRKINQRKSTSRVEFRCEAF